MGTNPRTHLTSGPEFHLSGERGREMIIDAGTTRQITMNENERKTHRIQVSLTESRYQEAKAKAAELGLSVSSYMNMLLSAALDPEQNKAKKD